ncbi:MAG: hypothetical protein ABJP48_12550 [Erythrobacter sp.]
MRATLSFTMTAIVLLLSACGEHRRETSEFFEEKTGLPLCSEARVSNKTIGAHDYEVDFTYSVDLELTTQCENRLLTDIKDRLNVECASVDNCSFFDNNNWFYELRRLGNGQVSFTLRAT